MKTIVLLVMHDTHFVELFRVAKELKGSGKYQPILWFPVRYPALLRDLMACKVEECEVILSASSSKTPSFSIYLFLKKILLSFDGKFVFFFSFVFGLYKNRLFVRDLINTTTAILQEHKPELLIVCEENVGYFSSIPIQICYFHHIPTTIIPYTIANATEAAEAYYDSFEHQIRMNLVNILIAKKYPHWVYEYRNMKLLRLPASTILPLERSGFSPRQPWKINSDETTFIAVENEHMLEYYRNEGLSDERLIVTGALYDDVLAASISKSADMHNKLISEMSLQAGLPLLLCALPPSQFPRDCEFSEYQSLVLFWMETLSQVKGWNVIVRTHPRLTEKEIDGLRQLGVKISNWDTASLVPLCDLYVASVSATIRWAIACGKPVVNYDVYQMNYSDYKNAGGVLTVFSKSAFKETIARLTSDQPYYEKIESIQLQEKTKWGRLDGRSSQRMLKLFDDVISGQIRRIEK